MAYNISSGVVSSGIKLEYDEMNVSAGGLISSTYILESGTLYISSGGVASTTVLSDFKQSSGEIYVLDGGTADILNVSGGKVYIQAGGKVTNAGVNGGLVEVAADGVLSVGGFASGARMHLYTDAALYAVNIVSGAIVNGFTLQNTIGFAMFIKSMITYEFTMNIKMTQQLTSSTRIFGSNYIDIFQRIQRSQGNILQVSNWCCY